MTEQIQQPSRYQQRLESAQQVAGYADLDDDTKALIAQLACDGDLDMLGFNEVLNAELARTRKIGDVAFVGASDLSEAGFEQTASLPTTFEDARLQLRHTYEDYRKGSDYSKNNPDDVAFYTSGALGEHMRRLHTMSDKYRQYARGDQEIEKELASRNDGGLWIEHHSLALVRERNTSDEASVRIYLNPKLQDAFDIYQEIFLEANKRGLRFQSKVFDPSWYGSKSPQETVADESSKRMRLQRRDPIVFYGFDESEDELLQLVEEIYAKHANSFVGRETGAVPLPLSPGMAIGDNIISRDSGGIKESLTSHRDRIFEKMPGGLSYDQQRKYMIENHVNPDNIAFNI